MFSMKELFEQLRTRIEEESKGYPIKSIVQCGSAAKGTSTDDSDIDVFVQFDLSYHWDKFQEYIIRLGPILFTDYEIKHATYPYIEAAVNDVKVNIVPCYYTESIADIKSPVDRSPHHVRWVNENLSEEQKADVKKLKEFLKLAGIYGADNNTKGFSGYLCEVLIHTFKSFEGTIHAYAFTEQPDLNKPPYYFNDPIDARRHLSAAVSGESWGKLIVAARKELGYDLPEIESIEVEQVHELLKDNLVTVKLPYDDLAKIRKETKKIATRLTKAGFNVLYTVSQPYLAVLLLEHTKLSKVYLRPSIIGLTKPKAYRNISKISAANTLKFVITDELTLSAIKVRTGYEAKELLESEGYNCMPCELANYSYKKALVCFK